MILQGELVSTQPTAALGTCDICGAKYIPSMLYRCRQCGRSYCRLHSALAQAERQGYWSESFVNIPPAWKNLCQVCFDADAAQPMACASCGQTQSKKDIFWGEVCADCHDYVCYACVRTKQRAGGGWESPRGVWDYKCEKHIGRLARGWKPVERPVMQRK